jgi:hypothetical protein
VKALGADRVVVVRNAVVIALALVERDEQQFGLAAGSGSTPAWNGARRVAVSQPTAVSTSRAP